MSSKIQYKQFPAAVDIEVPIVLGIFLIRDLLVLYAY